MTDPACQACGKPESEHLDSRAPGDPVPRCMCTGLKAFFRPRVGRVKPLGGVCVPGSTTVCPACWKAENEKRANVGQVGVGSVIIEHHKSNCAIALDRSGGPQDRLPLCTCGGQSERLPKHSRGHAGDCDVIKHWVKVKGDARVLCNCGADLPSPSLAPPPDPRFADMRCDTCGHAQEDHGPKARETWRESCIACPPERRCIRYVAGPNLTGDSNR